MLIFCCFVHKHWVLSRVAHTDVYKRQDLCMQRFEKNDKGLSNTSYVSRPSKWSGGQFNRGERRRLKLFKPSEQILSSDWRDCALFWFFFWYSLIIEPHNMASPLQSLQFHVRFHCWLIDVMNILDLSFLPQNIYIYGDQDLSQPPTCLLYTSRCV